MFVCFAYESMNSCIHKNAIFSHITCKHLYLFLNSSLIMQFILNFFYFRSQIALTTYIFIIYWKNCCKSSSLPVDRKYQKRPSRDNCIIVLLILKYKCRFINVILLLDNHNINAVSSDIVCVCVRGKTREPLGEPRL